MDKTDNTSGWRSHSAKDPFYTVPGPVEVETHDGERHVFKSTKGKRGMANQVARWRPISQALWAER